jgi:hypothetical protein
MEKFQINVNGHPYKVQRTGLFNKIYHIFSKNCSYEIGVNKEGAWELIDSGYPSEPINIQEVGRAIEQQEIAGKQLSHI